MGDIKKKPTYEDTESISVPSYHETEAIDEPQKKNPIPSQSSVEDGSLESKSTDTPSVSETSSISKPSKEENISTVNSGKIDAIKSQTREQLLNNPIFSDTNPNASKNKEIYLNNLKTKGYSSRQIDDIKSYATAVTNSKKLYDLNAPKVNQNPYDVDASYKTALGLLGMGKYDDAINLFNSTLGHLTPDKQDLGNSTQQDNMAGNIVTQKSASTNPSNSLYGIGYALSSKKDYKGSIDYYNEALKADPTNANAQKGLAYSKSKLGLTDEANGHLKAADQIEKDNSANNSLVGQIQEQAQGEKEQQQQSDQMKGTADTLEAFVTGQDPEGKLGNLGYLNPVGKYYSGIVNGVTTLGKGVGEIADGKVKTGALDVTLGAASTVFAAIPEVTAFNTAIAGIKETAKTLPKPVENTINTAVDFPFQAASMTAKVLGYNPDKDSDAKKVLDIADIIASFGILPKLHEGAEKIADKADEIKSTNNSINELKNISKNIVNGANTESNVQSLNEAVDKMSSVNVNDIKAKAEQLDTSEAKEIVQRINDVQQENSVSPEVDKMHNELNALQSESDKPMSDEAKSILQSKITDKQAEIANSSQNEVNNHVDESVNQVHASELNDRIETLKSDLENTDNEDLKQSINGRIDDLEQQKENLNSPITKETENAAIPEEAPKEPDTVNDNALKAVQESILGKKKDKSFLTNLASEISTIPEIDKEAIKKKGLQYAEFSNDTALKIGDGVIDDFKKQYGEDNWHEAAVNYAAEKHEGIPLSINAGIMGRVAADYIEREKTSDIPEEKLHYAEKAADVADKIDVLARDSGRFGSMLNTVYDLTPLGVESRIVKKVKDANNAKLDESYKGGKSNREKVNQAYEELEKLKADIEKEVQSRVDKKIDEQTQTERRKKVDKVISKLSDVQKKIKANSYSSVIPPDLIVAGIEVIKQAIDKGTSAADAIEAGIKHIKEKYTDKWEKEHLFRQDMEDALSDLKEPKETIKIEDQVKVLDKIFPRRRIETSAKRKAMHEKIIEAYNAGALDHDKFEKLFYEKFNLADIDNGPVKEFLRNQSDRIHKAADGGLKEREYTKMLNYLEDQRKASLLELVTTPFYANILSGYETHMNNAQFNIWSTIAQTTLLAEKNPKNAPFLAMKLLNAIPQGLKEGGNIIRTGQKFGEQAKEETLAERKADKGIGVSHYLKLPGRFLKAGDAIFNTPIRAMKKAELLMEVADNYNKSLPEDKRMNRKELQASVNDIMFNTTERKAQALEQAQKDIQKLEGQDVDLNDPKIAADVKLRQFEIMETTRPDDKYLKYGIDYDGINEQAQDFSNRSLLQGKPVGTLGAVSTLMHTMADGLPISRFAVSTFIDVPLNLANMMIDKSPLGLVRMTAYEITGKRGLFTPKEWADRNNIKTDLTRDQRKEAWIRAVNYTGALVGVASLTGLTYTDDKGKKRKVLEVTTDGTGDYQKNKEIQTASGGEYKEYTADFMGYQFSYKYNSILAPILTPIGAVSDYEKYKDKNPEEEKHLLDRIGYGFMSYGLFVGNQANFQNLRDIFANTPGKPIDEDNISEEARDYLAKAGGKVIRGILVSNFAMQANKDVKGLMDLAEKKPTEAYEYMMKDVPFVESILQNRLDHFGREIKSQFHLPIALVPDKLNIKGEDPLYKLTLEKHYYPIFVTKKTVFNGDDEVNLSNKQLSEVNKLRGKYVLDKMQSDDEIKGKTYMEFLKGLDDDDFKKEMNKVFKEGELKAKSEVMGLDVKSKLDQEKRENALERRLKGNKGLEKAWEIHRKRF